MNQTLKEALEHFGPLLDCLPRKKAMEAFNHAAAVDVGLRGSRALLVALRNYLADDDPSDPFVHTITDFLGDVFPAKEGGGT